MWKAFETHGNVYMLNIIKTANAVKISLTNLKIFWIEEVTNENSHLRFQECNPLIDIKLEEAIIEIFNICENTDKFQSEINETDNGLKLTIISDLSRSSDSKFKLKIYFELKKSESSLLTEQIIGPMIHTISYLEKQQKELCNLLEKKDKELEQHVMEKGQISRNDLITEKFDIQNISNMENEKLMLNVFNQSESFWESFVQQYGDIDVKILHVEKEPWKQINRKRKIYSSKTSAKKKKKIVYSSNS